MIDSRRLLDTFLTILRIDSYHPNEDPVIDALRPKLEGAGVRLRADPNRNVLGFWPGAGSRAGEEPVLLCAHTDTVRPTPDMEPVIRDGAVHTDGSSVLGSDDKAAVAAIVEAVDAIAANGVPHPPVEVLFTVGEDVGHIGSKAFDVAPVRSRMAFVPDIDGPVGGIVMASPWTDTLRVTFHGRAAHAGTEPEAGRSALQMAARAIQRMQLGRIDGDTIANAGRPHRRRGRQHRPAGRIADPGGAQPGPEPVHRAPGRVCWSAASRAPPPSVAPSTWSRWTRWKAIASTGTKRRCGTPKRRSGLRAWNRGAPPPVA